MALRIVLWIVAAAQLGLGVLTLFAPGPFVGWMSLPPLPAGIGYLLAMLGARFLASAVGLAWLARQPVPDRFWVGNMVLIQLVDFVAGVISLATGSVGPATAAFPMFNAALFACLLWWFGRSRPILAAP